MRWTNVDNGVAVEHVLCSEAYGLAVIHRIAALPW